VPLARESLTSGTLDQHRHKVADGAVVEAVVHAVDGLVDLLGGKFGKLRPRPSGLLERVPRFRFRSGRGRLAFIPTI
jgi:hypothetical protein